MRSIYLLGLLMLLANQAFAQRSSPDTCYALFTTEKIHLDGNLDEETWTKAIRIENFTQRDLNFGEPVTEKTQVAIAYDKHFLYVAVWCFDREPDKIVAKELRRDFSYDLDDNFILIIDTYKDSRNAFMFVTNPNGARADIQVFNNGDSRNSNWNGVWDVRTKRTAEGWFAEFEIPFYTLKYRQGLERNVWGVNFERNIRRKREQSRWQGWSRDNKLTQVNFAGTLLGMESLPQKQFVEIKPYAIGGVEDEGEGHKEKFGAGGDINYLITPTYRLNLTFNTDFAQVESDAQQINLTRFPLFFPELREFFLEGDDFFDIGFGGNRITPFYTRRIGLDENREAVPIIAGARLLGKERNTTLGIMSIQTAETEEQSTANYTSASWRHDIGKQSVLGFLTTNRIQDGKWHSTTGVNARYRTSKFLKKRNLNFGGTYVHTYNSDTALLPTAFAYRFYAGYPNDRLSIFTSTQRAPRAFNPELGLQRRQSFKENFLIVNYKPRPTEKLKWIRQFDFSPVVFTLVQDDETNSLQSMSYELRFLGFDTRSGERISAQYRYVAEGLDEDFNLTDSITIVKDRYDWEEWDFRLSTFEGRAFSLSSSIRTGGFYTGNRTQFQTSLFWRTNRFLNLSLNYTRNRISMPQGDLNTDLLSARLNYAFNPRVFGSFYGQLNTAADVFVLNYRLQLIPLIGTDFYLIVNQIYDTENKRWDQERSTVLAKLIWRFII